MSEQTPDSTNGLADGAEPSMEDILASIRKIIADDEASDSASEMPDVEDLMGIDNIVSDLNEGLSSDSEIDSLLSELDTLDSELTVGDNGSEMLELTHDNMVELEIPEETQSVDNELDDLLNSIEDISEPESLETNQPEISEAVIETASFDSAEVDEASDEDLSAMLDDMLNDEFDEGDGVSSELEVSDDLENLELVVDPAADLLDDSDDLEAQLLEGLEHDEASLDTELSPGVVKPDSDIELVKSLMAELTGEPLYYDEETIEAEEITEAAKVNEATPESDDTNDTELETLLSDLSGEDVSEKTVAEPTLEEASAEDVMDEILSLTIDDEMELQDESSEVPDTAASLKEIAAQAEADAKEVELKFGKTLAAATAGVAATAAVVKSGEVPKAEGGVSELDDLADIAEASPLEDDVETNVSELDLGDLVQDEDLTRLSDTNIQEIYDDEEISETGDIAKSNSVETEIEVETTSQSDTEQSKIIDEEISAMPRAVKTDAILDEVTETATADVFASLNKVVEEKAVVAERGDRIGDLVQEAIRPMLKEWLDANLKGIVERAVTKEVKRISSGK